METVEIGEKKIKRWTGRNQRRQDKGEAGLHHRPRTHLARSRRVDRYRKGGIRAAARRGHLPDGAAQLYHAAGLGRTPRLRRARRHPHHRMGRRRHRRHHGHRHHQRDRHRYGDRYRRRARRSRAPGALGRSPGPPRRYCRSSRRRHSRARDRRRWPNSPAPDGGDQCIC